MQKSHFVSKASLKHFLLVYKKILFWKGILQSFGYSAISTEQYVTYLYLRSYRCICNRSDESKTVLMRLKKTKLAMKDAIARAKAKLTK